MRSLYLRILLASLLTVCVSLAAFWMITRDINRRAVGQVFRNAHTVQVEQAIRAFNAGGAPAVQVLLSELNQVFGGEHHLVDEHAHDMAGGPDQSAALSALRVSGGRPVEVDAHLVVGVPSRDRKYWLIDIDGIQMPFSIWSLAPFYFVTLGALVFISWFVAVSIASPLRTLAKAADRFGRGDLTARVQYRSHSDIGTLAASFNEMADRIETLMTGQRRLLQDISHELRSPLARLNFAAELARTAPDRESAIDRLQKDIDRLSSLVGELLDITRAEGNPAARRFLPVDLDVLLAEVVDACQFQAAARRCTISVQGQARRPVQGDRELLRRAIENVLRNAMTYAPQGSDVSISVVEEPTRVSIAVRDLGPGVPEELLTSIFAPFFRVDQSREAATGGTGLGLSITARAVQLHHGTVRAENANPGLRVALMLPVAGR